jgi:retron-type reverse transcriptase
MLYSVYCVLKSHAVRGRYCREAARKIFMKTHKNLYRKITDFENIYRSWRKARLGKRYKPAASAFEQNLDAELIQLDQELGSQTWQPGGYRSFTVHEPKRRKISAAPFRDRVVHHALISVIESIYEPKFIFDSYANRKGKGTHQT